MGLNYVKGECIVTCGCHTQSAALRPVVKQSCGIGTVLLAGNLPLTLARVYNRDLSLHYVIGFTIERKSPSDIMQQIKGYTGKILREEFNELFKMPSLWTRNYFVSTAENVCSETIKQYVESQKKRY